MSPLVSAKVTPLRKTLATCVARVRFLSRVNSLVNLQVADAIEAFPTERADEPFLPDAPTLHDFMQLWVVQKKVSAVWVKC